MSMDRWMVRVTTLVVNLTWSEKEVRRSVGCRLKVLCEL